MHRHLGGAMCLLLLGCDTGAVPGAAGDAEDAMASARPADAEAPLDAGVSHERADGRTPDVTERDAMANDDEDAGIDAAHGACGAGDCNLLDPGSCADGEGCLWLLDEGDQPVSACLAVGAGLDGDPCAGALDCAPGLDCTAFDGSGVCRRYCCDLNESSGCPAGQFCRVLLGDAEDHEERVALCDACDGCSPERTDECPTAQGCYPLPGATPCAACLPAGAVATGEPCEAANDCQPGAGCFATTGDASRCHAFCVLDGAGCSVGDCREVAGATLPEGMGLCL